VSQTTSRQRMECEREDVLTNESTVCPWATTPPQQSVGGMLVLRPGSSLTIKKRPVPVLAPRKPAPRQPFRVIQSPWMLAEPFHKKEDRNFRDRLAKLVSRPSRSLFCAKLRVYSDRFLRSVLSRD
jgi:hypothetical protein